MHNSRRFVANRVSQGLLGSSVRSIVALGRKTHRKRGLACRAEAAADGEADNHRQSTMCAARMTRLPVMWAVNSPLRRRKLMMSVHPAVTLSTMSSA
jgi:hypothetical protein